MGQFQPGVPRPANAGRKKGSKNKTVKVSDYVSDKGLKPVQEIIALIQTGDLKDRDRLYAWFELLSYCEAKPKETESDLDELEDDSALDDLSEDELLKLRELRLVKETV